MVPQVVGDYEIGQFLAAGTVGNVFQARHRPTGRPAVIKFLQADLARTPEVQRRFVREVSVAEKLNHTNIVRHYDCGLADDQIYFAMELVSCGTLKEVLLKRTKLPWREAVECAVQVASALEYAHGLGVIHRDLKPANLFLSAEGHVKVGDFGLARDLNSTRITMDGHTVGTCRYMPPEQIYGDAALTGTADLYALGCILFEMLVGLPAFDGETLMAIFEQHLHKQPTPLNKLVKDCPRDLSDLVLRLLEKKPADRPQSAADVQAALVDILHARPMKLEARPAAQIAADLAAASHPRMPNLTTRLTSASLPVVPKKESSRKWLLILLGVIFAASAIGVAIWLIG
ncbi:MAG: serine/threonine-protein kinase [Pirellulales bacterium]